MQNAEEVIMYILMLIQGLGSTLFTLFFIVVVPIIVIISIIIVIFVPFFVSMKKNQKERLNPDENIKKAEQSGPPVNYVNVKCSHCGSISIIEEGSSFMCPDCGFTDYSKMP